VVRLDAAGASGGIIGIGIVIARVFRMDVATALAYYCENEEKSSCTISRQGPHR